VLFCIEQDTLNGPVNLTAPEPVRQHAFMAPLVAQQRVPVAFPIPAWIAKLGAVVLNTDTELMVKSRRVVPQKLLDAGFTFHFPRWEDACTTLLNEWHTTRHAA